MLRSELFEKVIREGSREPPNRLFERVLREANNVLGSLSDHADDIINTLNNLDHSPEANQKDVAYRGTKFSVCGVTDLMREFGITGTEIIITYDKIKEKHYGMGIKEGDLDHKYTPKNLKDVCQKLLNPVIISKYITVKTQGKNTISFYLNMKIHENWALVGIGIDPNGNCDFISTIYGRSLKDESGLVDRPIKYAQYVDWDSYPDSKELLDYIDVDTANPNIFK